MTATRVSTPALTESVTKFMHHDFAAVRPEMTVAHALADLRGQTLNSPIVYLYAVDQDGKLHGVVPVRRLLLATEATTVADVMVPNPITVPQTATLFEASELLLRHRFLALPVVDGSGKLLGLVDVHMFSEKGFEPAKRDAVDSVFQLIGVHVKLGRRVPPWISFTDRFPWLLCNIASGTVCALIAGMYEATIAAVTLIALFLTVVLALAESVSMQSMTLTLQGLGQGGPVRVAVLLRQTIQEIFTALMLGLGSGLLVGLVVAVWKHDALAAATVGGSILASMLIACMLGIFVPAMVRVLRVDPQVASGPITLALTDIFTLLIYFNTAMWVLT